MIGRRLVSTAVAATLALALPGCKKEDKSEASTSAEPAKTAAKDDPAKEDPAVEKPVPEVKPDPSGFTDPAVSYPSALDDLLDLVPADENTFVVVRDPGAVISLFGTFVADQVKGLAPLAKTADPELGGKLEESAAIYAKLGAELSKGVINLDKGMVIVKKAEAVIYGANDPSALPNLLKAIGAEEVPDNCIALAAAPGYAACGEDEAKLKALAPGKKSAELRKGIADAMPGFDLERGNFVGQFTEDKPLRFAVATPPGSLHVVVGIGELIGELAGDQADLLGVGKSTALGLADPGSAFAWGKLDTAALKPVLEGMGPPANTIGATFGGEVYLGGLQNGVPLALLLGVTDPYPAAGLIGMASGFLDQVPKELPDGTKIEVKVNKLQAGGKEVSVLHGKLSGSEQVKKLEQLGVSAEAFAFAAGKFAGAVIGTNDSAVKTIAEFEGGGPSQTLLERLPPSLARTLDEGGAAWVFYLPLDGLQAPQMTSQIAEGMAMLPASQRGGLPPDSFANALLSVVAPVSSVSAWMTHPEKARVLHVSVGGFADDSTEKGKAARDAVAKVTAGGDRKATYGALATQYPDPRFAARAGDDPNALKSAVSGAFMLGLMAALVMRPVESMGGPVPQPMIEPTLPPAPPPAPTPPPAPAP